MRSTSIVLIGLALVALGLSNLMVNVTNQHKIDRNFETQQAFQLRTVDRWDKLKRDNPDLKVPKVVEPINEQHLSDEEMQRNK